jgi:hypothetical protein
MGHGVFVSGRQLMTFGLWRPGCEGVEPGHDGLRMKDQRRVYRDQPRDLVDSGRLPPSDSWVSFIDSLNLFLLGCG